ncbi:MAG: hypothetical protein HYY84_10845 [Deltaproteobacteria bacterium]|nr:hypothetical protein [Deltaproteobacteria bacterium]
MMLRDVLDAFVKGGVARADAVIKADDVVDAYDEPPLTIATLSTDIRFVETKPTGPMRVVKWVLGIIVGLAIYIGVAAWLRHGEELPDWIAFGWPVILGAGLVAYLVFFHDGNKK